MARSKLKQPKTLFYAQPAPITMQTAARKLKSLLEQSVKESVSETKEIAVAFSGGLDSTIIAHLAKKTCANIQLIHVSLENQREISQAQKTAEQLDLPIHVRIYKEADVEKTLPKVLRLIEDDDPVQASIGIPIFWTAQSAAELNVRVMLAGQGADECFGGYKRYIDEYRSHGAEYARRRIFQDIDVLHEALLRRDYKICDYHNVELRLPFAAYEIAQFASSLPLSLKIEQEENSPRKLVLREVAELLGLPETTAQKPKKAMQYATGVDKALKKLAKREGMTEREYVHRIFSEIRQKKR